VGEPLTRSAQVVGWGMAVPGRILTNDELSGMMDTSDEWIRTRTGIRERRVVTGSSETTSSLAMQAARAALEVADLSPRQLDTIIVATVTPDYPFPSTACLVQDGLGAARASAFDLNAGCSGFVYGLSLGTSLIASGQADHVLVIGAETLSRITNWSDRNTCVLFGDGAGAVILGLGQNGGGVRASVLGADGSGGGLLIVPAGGSRQPASRQTVAEGLHYIQMSGREVFRFATRIMAEATREVVHKAGWELDEISLVIPHQANQRIIDTSTKRLKLDPERVFSNVERYGNTSAASIPIALCEAVEQKRVKPHDRLVLVGFGAGLTWAAAALEWGVPLPLVPVPWWKRLLRSLRYARARLRSLARRVLRKLAALLLGQVNGNDWRSRPRHWVDRIRKREAKTPAQDD
jgi:3-oxoacyl-[acyl-carrier-protein] synthase-3